MACECDARGRGGLHESPYPQRPRLLHTLQAASAVDSRAVAARLSAPLPAQPDTPPPTQPTGERIAHAIHGARVSAVKAALHLEEPDCGPPADC
jgi:tRNA nucleotidyltransferase (CCA-adding enzyme)